MVVVLDRTGEIVRVEDSELALLHLVLQSTHGQVNARVQALATGRDRPISLPDNLLEALTRTASDLADVIIEERDDDLKRIMARFAELSYLSTGNGYYLYTKGAIQLES